MSVKEQLHALCLASVETRIKTANSSILQTQASANEETKSSAGDKYETGRAMAQLEIEKTQEQLADAIRQRNILTQLDRNSNSEKVQPGSLVYTNQGNFYIAIAAGPFEIDGQKYFPISPTAPIGLALLGLKRGEKFEFNKREFVVKSVE